MCWKITICSKKPFTLEQLFSLQYPARQYSISLAVTKRMSQSRKWIWCRWHKSTDNFRFLHWIAPACLPMKMSLAVFVTLRNKVDPPLLARFSFSVATVQEGITSSIVFPFLDLSHCNSWHVWLLSVRSVRLHEYLSRAIKPRDPNAWSSKWIFPQSVLLVLVYYNFHVASILKDSTRSIEWYPPVEERMNEMLKPERRVSRVVGI